MTPFGFKLHVLAITSALNLIKLKPTRKLAQFVHCLLIQCKLPQVDISIGFSGITVRTRCAEMAYGLTPPPSNQYKRFGRPFFRTITSKIRTLLLRSKRQNSRPFVAPVHKNTPYFRQKWSNPLQPQRLKNHTL